MSDVNARQLSLFESQSELGEDLLIGAEEIARYLNWRGKNGAWNVRRIYHVAEKHTLPIHKQDGLGLVARKSALQAHFARLDAQYQNRLDGTPQGS